MIKFSSINDMAVVKNGEQTKKVLFKIFGEKFQNTNVKRMPLNISLVIDNSGSMNDTVGRNKQTFPDMNNAVAYIAQVAGNKLNNWGNSFNSGNTKMAQVKQSAIQCIDLLENDDFVSIITFNSHATLIQEAIQINGMNKQAIKNKILGISAGGGTMLLDGWLAGSMEVAKKLSTKSINRVLVLTDGETAGSATEIVKSVEGLARQGISTTTFGVGDSYNEDLLEKMATVSGGNCYYIEDENKVSSILREEFTCLNNVVANNATLEFISNSNSSVTCLNELDYVNKQFILGNIVGGKEVTVLLEFKINHLTPLGNLFNLGKVNLHFTNSEGKMETETIELNYHTVSDEAFSMETVNEEVNVQSAILEIAKQQKLAKEEMKRGNREGAYGILRGSICASAAFSNNARVADEIGQMNMLMDAGDQYSDVALSKTLSSMSYSTRTSKKQ